MNFFGVRAPELRDFPFSAAGATAIRIIEAAIHRSLEILGILKDCANFIANQNDGRAFWARREAQSALPRAALASKSAKRPSRPIDLHAVLLNVIYATTHSGIKRKFGLKKVT